MQKFSNFGSNLFHHKWLVSGLVFLTFSNVLYASEGGMDGGGGDSYAIQFMSYGNQIARYLELRPTQSNVSLSSTQLRQVVAQTQIQSIEGPLELDGNSVDAINFPDKRKILLRRQSWDLMNLLQKRTLVLHEYLGILRIDDARYQVSSGIVSTVVNDTNMCGNDDGRFRAWTVEFFKGIDKAPCRWVGNGTLTLSGSYLYTLRSFHVSNEEYVDALLMIGECNEATGKFEELQYSASSADMPFIPGSKKYWDDYCSIKKRLNAE